jgi:hypothetical protein
MRVEKGLSNAEEAYSLVRDFPSCRCYLGKPKRVCRTELTPRNSGNALTILTEGLRNGAGQHIECTQRL